MTYVVADKRENFQQSQEPRTSQGLKPIYGPSLEEIARSGGPQAAIALFIRTCIRAGERRERRGLTCWDREAWEYWARAARRAFGPSPRALFGQIALVETLLEAGCDGPTIAAELARIDANRTAEQQRKVEMVVRDRERAAKRDHEREVEVATQKEMVRLEAKRRAEALADEAGIARPGTARRRLVSTAQ